MSAPVLLDLSHTCHTRARTGVQRVARSLHEALGTRAVAVTHDPYARRWRLLEAWERENLEATGAAKKRNSRWPLAARLRGRTARWLGRTPNQLPENAGVLLPEIFSPAVARALPRLFAATSGPRVALFHDAIALKYPELTPIKTVARFPGYLHDLLAFDGIAAVSQDSRESLLDYWRWVGAQAQPPVETITLGISTRPHAASSTQPKPAMPIVLSVGSIEGRKNHLALLDSCERLWNAGHRFKLHLVGLAHPQTGAAALAKFRALAAAGHPVRYDGAVGDEALDTAYVDCEFTVYPSLAEGFGLPVIESLVHGKPCICSGRGALGESARGGGCIMLDAVDADSIAAAMGRLLHNPQECSALAAAAQARRFKDWPQYASELLDWMVTLRRQRG